MEERVQKAMLEALTVPACTPNATAATAVTQAGLAATALASVEWEEIEASVRGGETAVDAVRGGGVRGGRMMIERARAEHVAALSEVLGVPVTVAARALLDAAHAHGVPLIAGWDVSAAAPVLKVYANASDVSAVTRAELARAVVGAPADAAPHVIGLNITAAGVTTAKLYVQTHDVADAVDAAGAHPSARRLVAILGAHAGGAVTSSELDPSGVFVARAFFLALRPSADPLLDGVPGFDRAAARAALPFAPASCRSIGVDLARFELAWTAYFKPAGTDRPVWSLEPAAVFVAGEHEVGLFVEETGHADNAYVRTAAHALSYRTRRGAPHAEDLAALLTWAKTRVELAERERHARLLLDDPPAPWSRASS